MNKSPAATKDYLKSAIRRSRRLALLFAGLMLVSVLVAPADSWAQNGKEGGRPRARANQGAVRAPGAPLPVDPGPNLPAAKQNGLPIVGDFNPEALVSPDGMTSTMNLMLTLTVMTLAPSIFIMTTCFIRFIVVLGLLRQALGTQQLPPNQVIVSLALFLTFAVMGPIWQQSYESGIRPYTNNEEIDLKDGNDRLTQTFVNTTRPLRSFMCWQIDSGNNVDALWLFVDYQRGRPGFVEPETYDDVSIWALLPAFMLSELKTAFIIGFVIYLPFVIIDMVIASVLISMGMMMLPPVLISLPFKLLLFVLIDGWTLTVGMLLESVTVSESLSALAHLPPPFV